MYEKLKKSLNMKYNPVGVKLIYDVDQYNFKGMQFKQIDTIQKYCEYVRRAAQGEIFELKRGDFSCVTGEIMLGLKEPETIEFKRRLKCEDLQSVVLFPINKYSDISCDCVILIVSPRACMDISDAYSNIYDVPIKAEMGPHSGVCSDVTALVIKRQDINFSFLCVGSRIYAGYDDCELLCGIHYSIIDDLIKEITHLVEEREADIELMKQMGEYKVN